jgi:NAD(P)-dependent dehydrogenase (short-subunit alcohol dehydrogenase family)
MLAVTGYTTTIVQALRSLLPESERIERIERGSVPICERYLLCAGLLHSKRLMQQTPMEVEDSLFANFVGPMRLCECILADNESARICVMGSESGFKWSHDDTYAAAKAALHKYVETKKLKPEQQLICIAPSIIEDSGMTQRRTDLDHLAQRKAEHPKRRFLTAMEVARLIHFVLYVDEGYLSGQVIRLNGGA